MLSYHTAITLQCCGVQVVMTITKDGAAVTEFAAGEMYDIEMLSLIHISEPTRPY